MTKCIIQHRRGTSAQWNASDVILKDGEIAIEDTGDGYKALIIGDGTHIYAELPKLYLREAKTRKINISLPAANWVGTTSPYSQVVTVPNITSNSKIDLQPTPTQFAQLQNEGISLVTENNNGVITIYAIDGKPEVNYTIQATVIETN